MAICVPTGYKNRRAGYEGSHERRCVTIAFRLKRPKAHSADTIESTSATVEEVSMKEKVQ